MFTDTLHFVFGVGGDRCGVGGVGGCGGVCVCLYMLPFFWFCLCNIVYFLCFYGCG